MFRKILFISLLIAPGLVLANELSQEELEDLLAVKIRFARHMALNPSIVRAVEAQNSQQLALAEIKRRDDEWKNVGDEPTALIREITGNKVARYFERRVENNVAIDEVFLTDNQGANVAAFPPTSDYWQGDEEKWTASYNNGNGVVFIGPLEFDDSTQKTQVQISADQRPDFIPEPNRRRPGAGCLGRLPDPAAVGRSQANAIKLKHSHIGFESCLRTVKSVVDSSF
jgi:hypothetical protein